MTEQNRQPKGVPTGGQFAATARSESDLTLDTGAPAVDTVEVVVHGSWARDEIPPRCRTPRRVVHESTATAQVRRVDEAAAPVGIEVAKSRLIERGPDEFRVFDGDFYEPYRPAYRQTEPTLFGDTLFPAEVTEPYGATASSEEEFAANVADRFDRYLVVTTERGDEVWRRTAEPRYVVQTFGLGNDHGGTSIHVDAWDNPNIPADRYFRADDFESARAYAIETAEARGDVIAAARIREAEPEITVHDPSVLRLVTPARETQQVKDARHDYQRATRDYQDVLDGGSAADEAAAWQALTAARARLTGLTDDLTGEQAQRRPYEEGRTDPW